MSNIGSNGTIERASNGTHVVRIMKPRSMAENGCECENPNAPPEEWIWRKEFKRKRIYLPGELDGARRDVLGGIGTITLGMTGYSSLGADKCRLWGVTQDAYDHACAHVLGHLINTLRNQFPHLRIKLVDGASDMGVDRAILTVVDKMNLHGDHLGFSCPAFMVYVRDDDAPVYVGASQSEYAEAFIQSLDVLACVGGRKQALEFDMLAAIKYDKRLILLNVLRAICRNTGPQARDAEGQVEDAVTAFERAIFMTTGLSQGFDQFEQLLTLAGEAVCQIGRVQLPPQIAYGGWERGR